MRRRIVLLIILFSCLQALLAERPNVILIMTDDQGYADMSCHGNPVLKTPAMDKLHAEGVRLTDFHVDPTCSPTRGALMTGRYSARVGVWLTYGSRHHLRRDEVTMADVFQQNDYRTGIFGKWHLGDNYPFRPSDRGFEESVIHGGGVIAETPDYWDNDYYDDIYFRNNKPEPFKGYCTDVWFDEAIGFIEENRDVPFFCYISTNAPHGPLHVPESYRKPFDGEPARRAAFYGMIVSIDENIARLRDALERLELERNTIVVFLNDNGTNTGATLAGDKRKPRDGWVVDGYNAGMRGIKTSSFEGGHRAACFFYWPDGGLDGGRDVDGLTAHIDLLPTFIDLCGLDFAGKKPFDGTSIAGALKGKTTFPERTLIVHDQGRFGSPVGEGLLVKDKDYSVMRGSWRFVGEELFNLKTDPSQRTDVSAEHPELAKSLRAEYERWWLDVSKGSERVCPFVINPKKQRTVHISAQNLLGGEVAYSQRSVRKGEGTEGWTMIDVEKPGKYRIALRRWPRESGLALRDGAPDLKLDPKLHTVTKAPGKAFDVQTARLQVGSFDKSQSVSEDEQESAFVVKLRKGEQRIQTWFTMGDGEQKPAYYTYIEPVN